MRQYTISFVWSDSGSVFQQLSSGIVVADYRVDGKLCLERGKGHEIKGFFNHIYSYLIEPVCFGWR